MKIKRKILLSPLVIIILVIVFGVGVAGAAIYFGNVLNANSQNGLVGWWKFDGNATDSSSNHNDATVNGAALTTDRKGQVNKAYNFNGTTDSIEATSSSSLNVTNSVTIEGWIYEP